MVSLKWFDQESAEQFRRQVPIQAQSRIALKGLRRHVPLVEWDGSGGKSAPKAEPEDSRDPVDGGSTGVAVTVTSRVAGFPGFRRRWLR